MRVVLAIFIALFINTAFADSLVRGGVIKEIRLVTGDFQLTVSGFDSCSSSCLNTNNNFCYVHFNKNDGSVDLDDYKVFVAMSIAAFSSNTTIGNAEGNGTNCLMNYIYFKK